MVLFLPSIRNAVINKVLNKYNSSYYKVVSVSTQLSKSISTMKIGTHDGVFHCDEVLACYMLKQLPEYKDAQIIRSRNQETLKTCDIVVDVGAVFDHDLKRYDHHQREFSETFSSLRPEVGDKYDIKLSSAGLVYTFYGERLIRHMAPIEHPLTTDNLQLIYKKVYEKFIQEVDAIDNGVPMTLEEPKYKINTYLSKRVERLNPQWNIPQTLNTDELFVKAMNLVSEEFLHSLNYLILSWLPARDSVKKAIEDRFHIHKSGSIIEFTEHIPWKEHLYDLEEELGLINKEIKYVLFNDKPKSWRVQAVAVSLGSFITRKPLHKNWWGVRDQILSDVAGIEGCIFCHSTGFIGGNTSRNGALAMAVASLEAAE
ncbi:MYG1 protein [Leptidea sinapis]|uniref:MYG1 protein n=1 Tax=Leptidea sinapis TaxID=189913 RepID=UPI0021328E99|nr:MYG1 protein [Leptidea sinapis]